MQVGTYPTMNFATLGPSELQPPFTTDYFLSLSKKILPISTGQASILIHLYLKLAKICVFIKQSLLTL